MTGLEGIDLCLNGSMLRSFALLSIDYIVKLVYLPAHMPTFRFVTVQQRLTYFHPIAGPTLVSRCNISIT